jgi:phosphate transport system permease protein
VSAVALAATRRISARRHGAELAVRVLFAAATALAVALLLAILGYVLARGIPALNVAFFTERPLPFGEVGGGVAPAILGTVLMTAGAALVAVPVGIAAAILVVELRAGRYADVVQFSAELVAGLPSIVVGVFVWAWLVRAVVGSYSALAGAVALALIMVPIVARSVVEVLRLVPASLREAALALGAPRWRVVLGVVLPTARAGIATGIVLALARAAGETAPLMLTALGNVYFSVDPLRPIAALPLQIYQYAVAPYDDWHTKAWGGSLVLVLVIAAFSVLLRATTRRGAR